jgi:hypothetical protein
MEQINLDLLCGKMSPESFHPTRDKTSALSLSQYRKLPQAKTFQFLDLIDGYLLEPLWEIAGAWPGAHWMPNIGESPSVVVESFLWQILEAAPLEKYCLSRKAKDGMLQRAKRRGKELPAMLMEALKNQQHL